MLLFTTNASSICLLSLFWWTYLEAVPGHATRHALQFQQSCMQCDFLAAIATTGVVATGVAITAAAITRNSY